MTALSQTSRAAKRDLAQKLHTNLLDRSLVGPAEPALDAYLPELEGLVESLSLPITGNLLADAQRTARLAQLDAVDSDVDTSYRHVEGYLDIEARRRSGPHVVSARALHKAAFPDGLAHVDDAVADENRACRESLTVLRSPEYASTLVAIELPADWLDKWESQVAQSEALHGEIANARAAKRGHVSAGQDAEADFVELCVRLRRYVASRAKASDKARVAEGKALLAPLLDEMARLRSTAAARATLRENEKKQDAPAAPAPAAPLESAPPKESEPA